MSMKALLVTLLLAGQSVLWWIPRDLTGPGIEPWPIDIAPTTHEFLLNNTDESSPQQGWLRTAIVYRDGRVCMGEWWRPTPEDGQVWRVYLDESQYPTRLVLHADHGTLILNIDYPQGCAR